MPNKLKLVSCLQRLHGASCSFSLDSHSHDDPQPKDKGTYIASSVVAACSVVQISVLCKFIKHAHTLKV